MKKLIIFIMLLIIMSITKTYSQNFTGYRSGNDLGVNSVLFNPANIADSRYKWDVNLISFSGFAGNNKATFNFKDLSATNIEKFQNNFLEGNGNTNANINAEILGPSAMFSLTKKSAIAFSTRARVVGNLIDFDGNLVNSIINAGNATSAYNLSTNSNSRLITNAWSEFGFSYAREIANFGNHYFKAGITLKYLSGSSNNYIQIDKYKTTINIDENSQRAYFQNTSGTIGIGNGGATMDKINFNNPFGKADRGIGGDFGVVYEYRPEFQNTNPNAKSKGKNKYKFKVGLSLLDVGTINYKTISNNSASYNIHIPTNKRFYLDQITKSNIKQIKDTLDANPSLFTNIANNSGLYNASLPTVLQGEVDYHIHNGLYISVGGQLSLVSASSLYNARQYNSLTLTPRYEGKYFGVYFPLNYNQLTHFNAGLSLRAGPLFIGSGSLFTAIVKSKQADIYVGLRIGILQKNKM